MAGTVFVPDPVGWEHAFRSWTGPVGRDIEKRLIKGTALAKATVPSPGKPPRGRSGFNYSRGVLINTIAPVIGGRWGGELEGRIVAGARHAALVHGGTRPHIIRPRRAGGKLVFFWHKKGAVVGLPIVHHPGAPKIPFLSEHLKKIV